jgi:hypothetical protein
MIPVKQTKISIEGVQHGNCMAAAIASILELRIEDIPAFEDMPSPNWWFSLQTWLISKGYVLKNHNADKDSAMIKDYYIACGTSPRGLEHSVIYKDGKLVHDPHPDGGDIKKVTSIWRIRKIREYEYFPTDCKECYMRGYKEACMFCIGRWGK